MPLPPTGESKRKSNRRGIDPKQGVEITAIELADFNVFNDRNNNWHQSQDLVAPIGVGGGGVFMRANQYTNSRHAK